jgi:hypothetical protein
MKKLFIVLAVGSLGFAACNNNSESTVSAEDSARIADSTHAAWVQDSINKALADTLNKKADSLNAKADSLKK